MTYWAGTRVGRRMKETRLLLVSSGDEMRPIEVVNPGVLVWKEEWRRSRPWVGTGQCGLLILRENDPSLRANAAAMGYICDARQRSIESAVEMGGAGEVRRAGGIRRVRATTGGIVSDRAGSWRRQSCGCRRYVADMHTPLRWRVLQSDLGVGGRGVRWRRRRKTGAVIKWR